ncbi:MAG: hypothetical protein KatS3mg105_0209 [Gemmatales bacterium]|nr:MAG: hypothetical protein KatS3mg105_0209 [Gemmatales bacterium]
MRQLYTIVLFLGLTPSPSVLAQKPTLPPGVIAEENVEYANPDDQHLKLDLYRPKEGRLFPVVVCIHGGGFVGGHRETMRWICVNLATEGYAAATIQYRLAPKYRFPACVKDCKAAVRWLRANAKKYNLDPDRMAAMGTSAGGHLSVFLAATADIKEFEGNGGLADQSSRITCAVNAFGPSDFTRIQGKSKSEPVLEPFLGGTLQDRRRDYIQASPLYWITPKTAPVLTLIGTKDEHVPLEQARWLHERLQACGVPNELVILEGAGHGFRGKHQEQAQKAMLAFLGKYLKNQAGTERQPGKRGPQEDSGRKVQPRTVPFILILPAWRKSDKLVEEWNQRLARPGDLVVSMPSNLKDPRQSEASLAKVKGVPGWVTPSAEAVLNGDAKLPKGCQWLWYDLETWAHTPKKEKDDPVAAARALREYCNKNKLKLGMTPIYARFQDNFNLELAAKVASYCDAYILQCQSWQKDPQRLKRIVQHLQDLSKAIHKANPKCLVGCQLGTAKRYGGVAAALELYRQTQPFIQIYTAWWEPEEESVAQLLKALNKPRR